MPLTAQAITDAARDIEDLGKIVNGEATDPPVSTRTGPDVRPIAEVIAAQELQEEIATAQAVIATAAAATVATTASIIEGYFRDVGTFPDATDRVTCDRLALDLFRIRVLTDELYAMSFDTTNYEEYVLRDQQGYAGVNRGLQLVERRTRYAGNIKTWHASPRDQGGIPNADFAIRMGFMADPYTSDGDGGDWRYRGFGHGGIKAEEGDTQFSWNGAGNFISTAAFPIGTSKRGTSATISTIYNVFMKAASANNDAEIQYTITFGAAYGMRRYGKLRALVSGIGFQDSYVVMMAGASNAVNRAKLEGLTAETLTHPAVGVQRPTTYPSPWNTSNATKFQLYDSAEPTLVETLVLEYGQPLRQQGGGLAAWGLNTYGRSHISDNPLEGKFRIMGASSAEGLPRVAVALPTGIAYEWQSTLRTEWGENLPV
jgi:hypothetical protein